ncbi:similar to Saccharomyces cerevisiae YHR048W YHK8 Presumed antiporter of the DHA1 family of multidrug resistance transporters [Maudiozyma barnettii]|uniref:Similar to Saccharomyces cerevisiae YHR048W YHK8 Presumed antiporter of the DHA1 family of multidrug resistance transporters n=1 Tax=Maudiozyma barnettii TaxID=61262 RepID=A0A8H2VBT2_9SACH|nr:Yhk8p [Kazachstania barnettii]CAB4252381.1 similar to Saccharomyces cerevisiae YHR048W YHK8 Presumed antiporter of the DHA1 family of multidrug resistance transporters [Kazachstania barnettii]CAD1779116.1 similar to Saccharomyces cerevisiae YHR048W YHK8 Presumed antiporter of the DHA1 family of multidrug resistance transporters [Kazachstania barnettii]
MRTADLDKETMDIRTSDASSINSSNVDDVDVVNSIYSSLSRPNGNVISEDIGSKLEHLSTITTREKIENKISDYDVTFISDGPPDPENVTKFYSMYRKYYISLLITFTCMVITMISSSWTFVSPHVMKKFNISHEVSILGITLYVFGLAFGPLFLSPLSELYGRRYTFIISLVLSISMQCLTTWSRTIAGVMIGRFLSGFFGSSFLSVAGGTLGDLFDKSTITVPMAIFTSAAFLGPSLGPIISGAFYTTDYRWTFITFIIASGVCLILIIFTVPETYPPMLLINKAKRLRQETGDDNYIALLETVRSETSLISAVFLSSRRPFALLFRDPMMGVLCFYTGFELAIIYLYFVAFPYIFENVYGFGVMGVACAYIGMMVGMIFGACTSFYFKRSYDRKVAANNGKSTPEMKFEPLFYGAFLTPIGLMIFAWTCYPQVHWIGPIIGSGIFGAGVFYVFTGVFNYTVDAYRKYAASGLACNAFVRCVMGGVFPLFGLQMYKKMGINWAGFFIAMITVLLIPVPFLFTKYGPYLRSKSPYTWTE